MMNTIRFAFATFLFALPSVQATMLQVDFSGQLVSVAFDASAPVSGSFSGSILLDSSVMDSRPDDNLGRYTNAIIDASVLINGMSYTPADDGGIFNFNDVYVNNDQGATGDIFLIALDIANENGDRFSLGLQLQDLSMASLSSDDIPDMLSLVSFDAFDPNSTSATAGIFLTVDSAIPSVWGSLDTFEMRPVPVPAALWLLASALVCLRGMGKKHES